MTGTIIERQRVNKRHEGYQKLKLKSVLTDKQHVVKNIPKSVDHESVLKFTSGSKQKQNLNNAFKTPNKITFTPNLVLTALFCLSLLLFLAAFTAESGILIREKFTSVTLPKDELLSVYLESFFAPEFYSNVENTIAGEIQTLELKQLNTKTYTVQSGDTVYELAKLFSIRPETIVSYNNITNARRLRIGDEIIIPAIDGMPYTVKSGDSLRKISRQFDIPFNDLLDVNNLSTDIIAPGQQLFIPDAVDDYLYKRAIGQLIIWPTSGRISSPFGTRKDPFTGAERFHYGLDIANSEGTRINSAIDGTVVEVSTQSAFGKYIVVQDSQGLQTYYAHLSKQVVSKGQYVNQGQKIGEMGTTGRSTGNHLHFAIYKNGKAIDPMLYLDPGR